uniref:Uncharacterized protein n=1 Tax=Arundo donax TaxID=35708 RepID=A0A0A9CL68_ARUDO
MIHKSAGCHLYVLPAVRTQQHSLYLLILFQNHYQLHSSQASCNHFLQGLQLQISHEDIAQGFQVVHGVWKSSMSISLEISPNRQCSLLD